VLVELAQAINRFVNHPVWHTKSPENQNDALQNNEKAHWMMMETRLNEMLDRRRRLIRYMLKKEGKI
jgi:hypothetical protein